MFNMGDCTGTSFDGVAVRSMDGRARQSFGRPCLDKPTTQELVGTKLCLDGNLASVLMMDSFVKTVNENKKEVYG